MTEKAQIKAELPHKTLFFSHTESLTKKKEGKSKDD